MANDGWERCTGCNWDVEVENIIPSTREVEADGTRLALCRECYGEVEEEARELVRSVLVWEPTIAVPTLCAVCKASADVTVPEERYRAWRAGHGNIQDMLPELPAPVREQLITGICPGCWEELFAPEEEEEVDMKLD
jgi:hypothetical protein